jgi:hypothetical protein
MVEVEYDIMEDATSTILSRCPHDNIVELHQCTVLNHLPVDPWRMSTYKAVIQHQFQKHQVGKHINTAAHTNPAYRHQSARVLTHKLRLQVVPFSW